MVVGPEDVKKCDLQIWDKILDINLRSTYHFARNTLPEINKSPGGAVIRINSRDAPNAHWYSD